MKTIAAAEAFAMLEGWAGGGRRVQVVMTQERSKRAARVALLNRVLPRSEKVLVTLPDENGAEVQVTLSLGGAEWEQGVEQPESKANLARLMTATFPNGNRYMFGEGIEPHSANLSG